MSGTTDYQLDLSSQTITKVRSEVLLSFVVGAIQTSVPEHFGILSGWQWEFLRAKLLRAGISPDSCEFIRLSDLSRPSPKSRVIVGMGERVLNELTGLRGIDKWQLSPLTAGTGQKFIPTYDFTRLQKQYELGMYLELVLKRAHDEIETEAYERAPERFLLNPSFEETLEILARIKEEPILSVDVETGYGQINTVGFAWSASDAVAINVLPSRLTDDNYYSLWRGIASVLEGPSRKVFQNFIYDTSYFSAYGVRTANIYHDTMWAMKFLWPELKSNLGNVGRIHTKRPYWKDDGKVTDAEGAKKDWGDVRDWTRHYQYNCRDTTGTIEAHFDQRRELADRGLLSMFDGYLMRLAEPIAEMCANGMPLSLEVRDRLKAQTEAHVEKLILELHAEVGFPLNPRSPTQVMKLLREKGVKLPKKYDKESGKYVESADASSLKKVRLKYPDLTFLRPLAEVKKYQKSLSSYISFDVKPGEALLRYSLNGAGTETLRFSGNKDQWDRGFNIQTIPREGGTISIKQMFVAPPGWQFVEVDLRQAETRFVAYDSGDPTLIQMLSDGADIHRYVAAEIYHISTSDVVKAQRDLGKKSGHGANYDMKETVFMETCFKEMDLVLSVDEARNTLEAYHRLFPGIRRWHAEIRKELNNKRKLTAPTGWERYFYGRFGADMFKEAYAWKPQHTIPWITNHLMFHLMSERRKGHLSFKLLVQVHDSLIMLMPDGSVAHLAKACLKTEDWHPPVNLIGGQMIIPVEVKTGASMDQLHEVTA